MPVAEESFCHRRHHSLSWDLEQCEVPLHYVKLSMLWDANVSTVDFAWWGGAAVPPWSVSAGV